jgi:hypothetical protein
MTDQFVEELKIRHADAQRRLQLVQLEVQQIQAKYQSVAQEFNSLTLLLNVEAAKQKALSAGEDSAQASTPDAPGAAAQANTTTPQTTSGHAPASTTPEISKTDMIRQLLRQYPGGITPTDLWKQVKTRMTHRAYLYSVLKRLKDKGEVMVKRGKYITRIMPLKTEEEKEQNLVQ